MNYVLGGLAYGLGLLKLFLFLSGNTDKPECFIYLAVGYLFFYKKDE